jgi:hypothetical protein
MASRGVGGNRRKGMPQSHRAPLKRMQLGDAVLQIVFGKDEKSEEKEGI